MLAARMRPSTVNGTSRAVKVSAGAGVAVSHAGSALLRELATEAALAGL